jgi:hypothetical protein
MDIVTIEPPDTRAVAKRTVDAVEAVNALEVVSPDTYAEGAAHQAALKAIKKDIEGVFKPNVARWHEGHKAACAEMNKYLKPVETAYKAVGGKMGAWSAEQERKRREQEAALREQERKRAEEEQLRQAAELEEAGHTEAAEALIEAPVAPAPVHVATAVPKVSGVTQTVHWKFRIVNAALIPREYLIPDEKAIGARVRTLKKDANIPGVEPYPEHSTSSRA